MILVCRGQDENGEPLFSIEIPHKKDAPVVYMSAAQWEGITKVPLRPLRKDEELFHGV